jgi:hypothetical protein
LKTIQNKKNKYVFKIIFYKKYTCLFKAPFCVSQKLKKIVKN